MSDYVFGCPKCNREFRILPEFAGETIQCPHCSQKMRIPSDYFDSNSDPTGTVPTNSIAANFEQTVTKKIRADQTGNRSSGSKSNESLTEHSGAETKAPGTAARLPPQFAASPDTESRKKTVSSNKQSDGNPPKKETTLAGTVSLTANTENEESSQENSRTSEMGSEKSDSENSATEELDCEKAKENSISHLLPPPFAILDPGKFRRNSNSANSVLLPTADGGVQSVSERLVTIEYKGQKYVVIAMSPEEKRRRQIVANVVSVFIAICAIAGTIWFLMK